MTQSQATPGKTDDFAVILNQGVFLVPDPSWLLVGMLQKM